MTTIYVRIPRNRWTPIGEIDLDGWHQAYHDWKTAIKLNPEIEDRMRKATVLSLKIRDYENQHDVTTRADRGAPENQVHVKLLQKLETERWQESPHKYLRDQPKVKGKK
jgi:hypothetical protein